MRLSNGVKVLKSLVGDNWRGAEASSGSGGRDDLHASRIGTRSLGGREGLSREGRTLKREWLTQHGRFPPG